MPLYEFRCPEGHDFEKFYRSIGAAPSEEKCPECGAMAARVMSAAGLVFKGSGFYITDYGKDGKKAEREAASSKAAEATKAESKTPAGDAATTKGGDAAPSTAPAPAATETKTPAPKPATSPVKKAE